MEPNQYYILLVDDEPDILEFLSYNLKKEGYNIYTAQNGHSAIQMAKKVKPHLILLDIMMPDMDGIETCEEIRQVESLENTIVAFLTARSEDYSQIAGFEAGGDDYISKPIKPKVLVSRIRALLKRYDKNTFKSDKSDAKKLDKQLLIDKEKYIVISDDKELALPKKEFELLALLISRPEKVFSREEIFKIVWGENIVVGDRTIDVHVRKLREKIGNKYIKTIKGVGYKYTE